MHHIIADAYQYNNKPNRPQRLRFGYRLGFKYTHCLCGEPFRQDEKPVGETMCSDCLDAWCDEVVKT